VVSSPTDADDDLYRSKSSVMKVLHVIPSLDPASGGPPIVAASLAAAQAALGCESHIVSYRFPKADSRILTALRTIPGIDRVKLEYLTPLTRGEPFFARGARRSLAMMVEPFDLIHLHGVWDPVIRAAALACSEKRKPFVLTPHGMLDPWALRQKALKKRMALLLGYRRMLNDAAFLHFLTDAQNDRTAALHLTSPAKVIPNGIFLEEVDPLPQAGAFCAAHPEFGSGKLVLFLGRLHYKKGLDILADAFAVVSREFADAHLVVAGPDYGAQAGFEFQIARLGIAAKVHLLGPLYGAQKLAAYRDCNCFCLPSRQEGFSLAIIEAMACEAPVVISTACYFAEAAEAGAGIVTELDAAAVAAGIATVFRDAPAARMMGKKGRELVVRRYTWREVAREMAKGYGGIVHA